MRPRVLASLWRRSLGANRPGRTALFLATLLASAASSDVPTHDEILRRHVAWLGGRAALERLQDLTWTGHVTTAGLQGTLTLRETLAGWRHLDLDLGPVMILEVIGPEGAWVRNPSGQVEPMGTAKVAVARNDTLRDFARHLLDSRSTSIQDLGSEEHAGRRWRVVRFTLPNGDHFDLFLDTDGSCSWIREQQDQDTYWTELGDWRMVSGVRVPFSQRTLHDDAQRNSTIAWTGVTVNRRLVASAFARPAPRAGIAAIAGGARSTGWIDVELIGGRYIYIAGTVNGRDTPILLDSGAGTTVLSTEFAATLNLGIGGAPSVQGATRAVPATLARGVDIGIGSMRLSDLTVLVVDLAGVAQGLGRPVPVALGKEAFQAFVVDIDYPAAKIAFHSPASYEPDAAARSVSLVPGDSGETLVEARVEGLPPALFSLDTGAGNTLTLFKPYVDEHALLEGRAPRSEWLVRGVSGGSVATVATLRSVVIGGLELREVPAEFLREDGAGAFKTRRLAGNLGAGILSRFHVALDYSRGRMHLIAAPGWNRPFCKDRVGLQIDYRQTYLDVVFVAPGSPADKAGWRVGDRITAIDAKPIGADYYSALPEWWCGEPGSSLVISDDRGMARRLVFADFY